MFCGAIGGKPRAIRLALVSGTAGAAAALVFGWREAGSGLRPGVESRVTVDVGTIANAAGTRTARVAKNFILR